MSEHDALPVSGDDHVYLLGRPSLREFIQFVNETKATARRNDDSLTQLWKQAWSRIRDLEIEESGIADSVALGSLPPQMLATAGECLAHPAAQRAFRIVRHQWWMVEIDRLIVFQKHINKRFVRDIEDMLPPELTDEYIIQFAVGKGLSQPPVRITRAVDGAYWFSSSSSDLRFLDVTPLDPSRVDEHHPMGDPCALIGIFVGFGFNVFNAVQVDKRLILLNGSHRLYALRQRGITHAPCLVGHPVNAEELELVLPKEVKDYRSEFLTSPRPPIFKDYFDPTLHGIIPTPRFTRMLRLELTMRRERVATT